MSLSARDQEALDRIEARIAGSDSNLAAMLDTFTRLTSGEQMPEGEEVHRSRKRERERRRRLSKALVHKGAPPGLPWLPAAVILIMAVLIAVAVAVTGSGKGGTCTQMRGLVCVSRAPAYPSAHHPG